MHTPSPGGQSEVGGGVRLGVYSGGTAETPAIG